LGGGHKIYKKYIRFLKKSFVAFSFRFKAPSLNNKRQKTLLNILNFFPLKAKSRFSMGIRGVLLTYVLFCEMVSICGMPEMIEK
jgi:hypothetical protein